MPLRISISSLSGWPSRWSGTFRPNEASTATRSASDELQLELPDEQIGAVVVTNVRKVLATQVLMSLVGRGPTPF